ncbi:hypothetical protein ACFL27_04105 [candidate division CSSED10-310 bacterium]|uniref:Lipoprotein n=1 Tax=candidate division CSSED10-310 bacterium TaxID=2855610 RepID=A0ABV6YTF3_UNCC1
MKKRIIFCFIAIILFSSFFLACTVNESDEEMNEQQPVGGLAILLNSLLGETGISFTEFTWNLFDGTYYDFDTGWWHTSFDFELSNGDHGHLGLEANFQDNYGADQMLPNDVTVYLEAYADFFGRLLSYPTSADIHIILTREPRGTVITAVGEGKILFETVDIEFRTKGLVIDLDVLYPEGTVSAHVEDVYLGVWDCLITFDGTNIVVAEITNDVETFVFHVDLDTGAFY